MTLPSASTNLIENLLKIRREMMIRLAEASRKSTGSSIESSMKAVTAGGSRVGISVMAPGGYAVLVSPHGLVVIQLPTITRNACDGMWSWPFTHRYAYRRFRVNRGQYSFDSIEGEPFKIESSRHPEGWAAYVSATISLSRACR